MSRYFLMATFSFLFYTVNAQAFETTLKLDKVNEPVIAIDYNFNKATVALAIKTKLSNYDSNAKQNGLWTEFLNVSLTDVIKSPLNYLFRLDEAAGNAPKTRVYLIMRSDKEIMEDPSNIATNAKTMLNQLGGMMTKISSIQELKKQEQLLIEEELKLDNLKKQEAELEEKIKELQNAQAKQARIVASQKKIVEDIKEKL